MDIKALNPLIISKISGIKEAMGILCVKVMHDIMHIQRSACTTGGLVERPGSNEMVWVSHTFFLYEMDVQSVLD